MGLGTILEGFYSHNEAMIDYYFNSLGAQGWFIYLYIYLSIYI